MSKEDFIYGIRAVTEAIKSGKEIDKVLLSSSAESTLSGELRHLLKEKKIVFHYVPPQKINQYTRENHQGVICFLAPISFSKMEDVLPSIFEQGRSPLLLILDRITDVRNFGAIARTAECAGCDAIIIPEKGSAQINADAVKTSAGALYKIPICREANLKLTLEYLKASGIRIVACTEKAEHSYTEINMNMPIALIMGSENEGISPEYLKRADDSVFIPMKGKIESLNVSVACGIMLFEAIRQRSS